jgi:adenine-specific DNA-methyltransferase
MTNSHVESTATQPTPTDQPERLDLRSRDISSDRQAEIVRLFPEVRTEGGKIDFDRLKRVLGETVDPGKERYGMNWPGKADCFKAIQSPSLGTLLPSREESLEFDKTENLIIEGDNLEVLKLLQKAYLGKVSLIYLDPPYNTGNDFIYPDNYTESLDTYLQYTGQIDAEGRKFSTNTESDGRFHSKWINMMYPRLYLARNLLRGDGLMVVQIDDSELPNLRRLLDEIFGEENYVNTIAIKAKVAAGASGGGEDKRLKKNVEFALVYARDTDYIEGFTHCYTESPLMDVINDMRASGQSWKYTSVLSHKGVRQKYATVKDGDGNPIDIYLHTGIKRSSLRDICDKEGMSEEEGYKKYLPNLFSDTNAQTSIRTRIINAARPLAEGEMFSAEYVPTSGRDKGKRVCHYYLSPTIRRVIWLSDVAYESDGKVIKKERTGTLWDDISYNNIGKEGDTPFPNGKKPVQLIRRVLGLSPNKDDLVLDFFAGSGTTAQAVWETNLEDQGTRRFILVQLPEPLDDHECKTVAEITKLRVRRVAQKLSNSETGRLQIGSAAPQDYGFRALKLAESNFTLWNSQQDHNTGGLERQLELHINHVKTHRTGEDILFEILSKSGFPPSAEVGLLSIEGKIVFSVANGAMLICLEKELNAAVIKGIAGRKPERVVCLDEGFAGNDQLKANAVQIMKSKGVTSFRTV